MTDKCAFPDCSYKATKKFLLDRGQYYVEYCDSHYKGAKKYIGHMEFKK